MSASSGQLMQLAMLETIRVLRRETAVEEQEMEESGQEESESEDEEDLAALYQRMNISRRMSLPANLAAVKHDDSQRRLQRLQRARRSNFNEDDSQEEAEEEEEGRGESNQPMAMNAGSPARPSDMGGRRN